MINGNACETIFNRKIAQIPTVKVYHIDSKTLIANAINTQLGRRRLELAAPFLELEYGINVRSNDKLILNFDWRLVPASVILDCVYGIDFCFNFLGWTIAIDVTTNPEALENKIFKQKQLSRLFKGIGIDKSAVCLIHNTVIETNLKTALKQIIRGAKVIKLAA